MTRRYTSEIAASSGPTATSPAPTSTPTPRPWPGSWTRTPCIGLLRRRASVTGKPLALGGSAGPQRRHRAGRRSSASATPARSSRKPVRGATVAVQGFGNAGAARRPAAARGRRARGARSATAGAASTRAAAWTSRQVRRAQGEHGLRRRASRAPSAITNEELLEVKCDVLVPAALEDQITLQNAARVRARIVAEAANGPTTPGADRVLRDHGVFVIPDILCNAGGVTVSYFEWAQNLPGLLLGRGRRSNRELEKLMKRAFHEVHETSPPPQARHAHRRLRPGRRPGGGSHPRARPLPLRARNPGVRCPLPAGYVECDGVEVPAIPVEKALEIVLAHTPTLPDRGGPPDRRARPRARGGRRRRRRPAALRPRGHGRLRGPRRRRGRTRRSRSRWSGRSARASSPTAPLAPGQAVQVMTGAPVPAGRDRRAAGGEDARARRRPAGGDPGERVEPGAHIARAGLARCGRRRGAAARADHRSRRGGRAGRGREGPRARGPAADRLACW